MAEGNGEIIEEMATSKIEGNGDVERTPDYPKLVEYGLDKRVSILIDKCAVIQPVFALIYETHSCIIHRWPVN